MNMNNTTVVICCAGMGTRLGIGLPKALVNVNGEPLIIHLLKLLDNFSDVRVVVGFQGEKIIDVVKQYRKDVMFVFNYDYETTGPAASLSKALVGANEIILSIGGDVLINSTDFKKIIEFDECVLYTDITSDEPTLVNICDDCATCIGGNGQYEWQGIVKIRKNKLYDNIDSYIYKMINPNLPLNSMYVRSREVDSQDDYDRMIEFYNNGCN